MASGEICFHCLLHVINTTSHDSRLRMHCTTLVMRALASGPITFCSSILFFLSVSADDVLLMLFPSISTRRSVTQMLPLLPKMQPTSQSRLTKCCFSFLINTEGTVTSTPFVSYE